MNTLEVWDVYTTYNNVVDAPVSISTDNNTSIAEGYNILCPVHAKDSDLPNADICYIKVKRLWTKTGTDLRIPNRWKIKSILLVNRNYANAPDDNQFNYQYYDVE